MQVNRLLPLVLLCGCPVLSQADLEARTDQDQDGVDAIQFGGTDCDDNDADVTDCEDDTGDTDDLDCESSPCGGDPTGAWTLDEACVVPVDTPCPEADSSSSGSFDGELTFVSNGTYALDGSLQFSMSSSIPPSCLTEVSACSELEVDGVSCVGEPTTTGCECDFLFVDDTLDDGTWSVVGNDLLLNDGTLDEEALGFCQQGDSMSLHDTAEMTLGDTVLTLGVTLVLTR